MWFLFRNGEAVNKNVNNKGDLVVQEAADVLREWSEVWKSLYVMRDTTKFNQLKKLMDQLAELRRTLAAGHMSSHQRSEVRMKIVDKINLGTRLLDLDMIPREADGNPTDPKTASAVHVFDMVKLCENANIFILAQLFFRCTKNCKMQI